MRDTCIFIKGDESEVLCEHYGKKGHRKKDCWSLKKEQKAAEQKGGKGDKGGKGGKDPKVSGTESQASKDETEAEVGAGFACSSLLLWLLQSRLLTTTFLLTGTMQKLYPAPHSQLPFQASGLLKGCPDTAQSPIDGLKTFT